MRTLEELLATDEPAWPLVQSRIAEAVNRVEVLPPQEPARSEVLLATQVTVRSPLGAVVHETGGMLIDGGWLRILGSGHPRLPRTLTEWNRSRPTTGAAGAPPFWLVADDAVGGFFAWDNGTIGRTDRKAMIHYFAPDTLEWESMEMGYADWLGWCLEGDLAGFYESLRWPGWEAEVASLRGDQGLSIVPFLFLDGPSLAVRSRRPVPIDELYSLHVVDLPKQLARRGGGRSKSSDAR